MAKEKKNVPMRSGTINTAMIYDTHRQIKTIVESYKVVNEKVRKITAEVNANWSGEGHNEFQSQYENLIGKIEDFGDTLKEIYDALVEAEAKLEDTDDDIRQDFVMATKS